VGDLPVFKTDLVQTFPAPGEEIRQGLPTLTWEAYPGAAYYGIYFGQSLYLSTSDVGYPRLPDVAEKVLGPAYPISRPLPGCQYTWKVEAYNARGVKISESAANDRVFTLSGQASSCTIQLSSPVDDAVINEGEPITFTWQGQAPYFYLSINDTHYRANGAAYTLAEGLPVGEYAWKVTAYDEDRQVAESGGAFTFRVVGAGAPSTGQTPGAEETTPSPVAATPATTQPAGDLIDETGWIEIVYSGMVDPSQDEPTELGQALVFHGPGSVGVGFACSGCIILEPSPNLTLLVPAEDQAEGGTVFHSGEEYQYRIKATPTGRTLDDIFLGSLPVYAVSYLERLK
jgi:hypothetical protein